MKKSIFLMNFVFIAFMVTSCNNENEAVAQIGSEDVVFNNPYDFIGVLHNAAMDSVKSQKVKVNELENFTRDLC